MKSGGREGVYSSLFLRLDLRSRLGAGDRGWGWGLEDEPEMRGGSGVRAPQHPGIAFFLSPSPHPLPPHPYRQEAEVKKAYPGCLLATPGGHVTQPADSGGARLSGWACCSHDCPARDPGRTVIVRMSGKDRIEIFPSRMAQTIMRARLKGAQTGRNLLKKKSDALTLRFRQILKKIIETKMLMGEVMREAAFSLAEAKFTAGDFR
uniref:V-type proton ATPase subunit D n=1 Tax=Balaenoptera musculus TaxID=9771 RepID=A0A8C0C7D8_BALMU